MPQNNLQDDTIYFINDQDFYVVKRQNCSPCYIQKQYTVVRGNNASPLTVPTNLRTVGLYIFHDPAAENPVVLNYFDGTSWYSVGGSGGAVDYLTLEAQLVQDGFIKRPFNFVLDGTLEDKTLSLFIVEQPA